MNKLFKILIIGLAVVSRLDATPTPEELIRKARDEQNKIMHEKDDLINQTMAEKGESTWQKTDSTVHIAGALLLGALWYITRSREPLAANSNTEVIHEKIDQTRRFMAVIRALSITFATITLPAALWRLIQGINGDYILNKALGEYDKRTSDLKKNIQFLETNNHQVDNHHNDGLYEIKLEMSKEKGAEELLENLRFTLSEAENGVNQMNTKKPVL